MTNEELQTALAYWQKRLRLADWHIVVKFATPHELRDCSGDCSALWETKHALIRILPEDQYSPTWLEDSPVSSEEETLVHELLHCTFAGFEAKQETRKYLLQHQAIHAIAVALIEEHRREAAA